MFLRITERDPKTPEQKSLSESTTRLIKKLDLLTEKLRQELAKPGEGGSAGAIK